MGRHFFHPLLLQTQTTTARCSYIPARQTRRRLRIEIGTHPRLSQEKKTFIPASQPNSSWSLVVNLVPSILMGQIHAGFPLTCRSSLENTSRNYSLNQNLNHVQRVSRLERSLQHICAPQEWPREDPYIGRASGEHK